MAHILEFTVDGLAGRSEPYSATLNRDVNVFFGLNGSGKTTLLKILHSALSTETDILDDLPFKRAQVTVYLNRHESTFVRSFSKEVTPSTRSAEPEEDDSFLKPILMAQSKPKWTSDPVEPQGGTLTHHQSGFLPISRLYRNVRTSAGARRLSDQELDRAFALGLQTQWREYYADISNEITKTQERGLAHILGFFLSGGSRES